MNKKEQVRKLAQWALSAAIGFIGIGLYMAWSPLAFLWLGAWMFAAALVWQRYSEKIKDE